MYYGTRYYLPQLRRFISADTIVPSAASPQAFNRYSYSYNDPINYIDPSGHEPEQYTDEWWVWRYYELELWKYEDPGHDVHTKDQFVDRRKEQLKDFGVTFGEGEELLTLESVNRLWQVVSSYAAQIQSTVKEYFYASLTTAFVAFMGRTRIVIEAGSEVAPGRYAEKTIVVMKTKKQFVTLR